MEPEWCSGESTRLVPTNLSYIQLLDPAMCGFEFVGGFLLAVRGFSLGTTGFSSPQKLKCPNSNKLHV